MSVVSQVNHVLAGHAMAGQGRWFVYYARRHHLDLGLLVGIAGAETTFGDEGTGQPGSGFNAFGMMRNGPGTGLRFGSFKAAIAAAARNLDRSLYNKWVRPGRANPAGMMPTYVGYTSHDWLATVSKFANSFGTGKSGGGAVAPRSIVQVAKSWLGVPYVYAGASRQGVDCSGFVMEVYKHFGITLPHYTGDQIKLGTPVNRKNLRPGDLVFLEPDSNGVTGHVVMYIGHGKIIEAAHTGTNVRIMSLDQRIKDLGWVGARRYVQNPSKLGFGGAGNGAPSGADVPAGPAVQTAQQVAELAPDTEAYVPLPGSVEQNPEQPKNWAAWQDIAKMPGISAETQQFAFRGNLLGGE